MSEKKISVANAEDLSKMQVVLLQAIALSFRNTVSEQTLRKHFLQGLTTRVSAIGQNIEAFGLTDADHRELCVCSNVLRDLVMSPNLALADPSPSEHLH